MKTSLFTHHHAILGPSPFWRGLFWWGLGVGYCLTAWHLHRVWPLPGLLIMGLAPFANLFCFFSGLNCLRRARLRWITRRAAERLGLAPTWGSGLAGFFLVDEARGVCVANGAVIRFADVAELECRSTPMAHRLLLRVQKPARPLPFEVGFSSEPALMEAVHRLHAAMQTYGDAPAAAWIQDMDGNRTPLRPANPL